ncbi:hypothetical protein PLICRDRAFT_105812 [Plicaturopsis crispa FD-325 SS-3]|nr:hypothetical protein PLICRDRAFT_105812 [Plicaturopsis crispa FD-325 SS-3]
MNSATAEKLASSDAGPSSGIPLSTAPTVEKIDIEHVFVENDPRQWSRARKNLVLIIVSCASLIAGLCANIQNPSIQSIEDDLHASSSDISLSISLFILCQGTAPILWSAVSEIKGRKLVYLVSVALFAAASAVVATAKSIGVVIGMRCVQGLGSSAVMAIGAATLADIFDPSERGSKMGIYYAAPMLGPSLGPILGGVLTEAFNWRASFWFLVIWGGIVFVFFLTLFKDTFRRERSMTYQSVLRRRTRERARELQRSSASSTVGTLVGKPGAEKESPQYANSKDLEAQAVSAAPTLRELEPPLAEIKLSLMDVNPFKPIYMIIRRVNNFCMVTASGLIFAFSFSITYTSARTLGSAYGYNALQIGLVLLAFGIGSMSGSVAGGHWSDRVLAKARKEGKSSPEMRLQSAIVVMWFLPPSIVGYAWTCQEHVHVSAICVMLFLAGFCSLWMYASTLAYIVDANVGRSSTVVALNSAFRGLFAFVAAEVAVPLQESIGDGGMYTLWAGILVVAELLLLLVLWKGGKWREMATEREERKTHS